MNRLISRTAVLTGKTCKFKRYLTFHYGGHGLSSEAQDLNLLTGTCIHRGLQHLLEHCKNHKPDESLEEKCINEAVEVAIELYKEILSTSSLALKAGEMSDVGFVINEHEALIEGLIRCFAIKRLPSLLEEYEVLEVEHEEIWKGFGEVPCANCRETGKTLDGNFCSLCDGMGSTLITFLSKADGLFRRKLDNKLIVLSIKTTSEYADVTMRNILHDMQGCSEWAVIQHRIDEAWDKRNKILSEFQSDAQDIQDIVTVGISKWDSKDILQYEDAEFSKNYSWMANLQEKPEIYAVQYEHLVTGKRWQDPAKSGIYKRQNFLVHPMKLDQLVGMNIFTQQKSFDPESYKWKWGSGRQAKGWNKINIWEDIGIKMWIELLCMGTIQPEEGDPLSQLIITSELIIRTPDEILEWEISTRFQEERIAQDLDYLDEVGETAKQTGDWEIYTRSLAERFDKNSQSCHNYYGNDCIFVPICHAGVTMQDSLDSGLYSIRRPHHDLEAAEFEKKGFLK